VDGEGTICFYHSYAGEAVTVNGLIGIEITDPHILDWVVEKWGGKIHHRPARSSRNHKDRFIWRLTTQKAVPCVKSILPFLKIKQKQARLLLELAEIKRHSRRNGHGEYTHKYRPKRQEAILREGKRLNKVGR